MKNNIELSAPFIGCLCLGLTIGWLVRFFVEKYKEYDAKLLSSTVTVLSGGGIVALLKYVSSDKDSLLAPASFYLIGLPIGMLLLYPMVFHWDTQFRLATKYDEQRAEIRAQNREQQNNKKQEELARQAVEDSTAA